ncbi:MAG: RecX family transcriptional regulator [Bacteroidetes bacterium]|nr:RecX family transcriptional regulator [Bacteroidota bacterium]
MSMVLEKMRHYCAYQERCHQEVRARLSTYRLSATEAEALLAQLIEEGYLNEERFALAWAGGKFRMLQWGRVRIRHELRRKGLGDYNIRKALESIPEAEYQVSLERLARQRWGSIRRGPGTPSQNKRRLANYLLQRGFEPEIVWPTVEGCC